MTLNALKQEKDEKLEQLTKKQYRTINDCLDITLDQLEYLRAQFDRHSEELWRLFTNSHRESFAKVSALQTDIQDTDNSLSVIINAIWLLKEYVKYKPEKEARTMTLRMATRKPAPDPRAEQLVDEFM